MQFLIKQLELLIYKQQVTIPKSKKKLALKNKKVYTTHVPFYKTGNN